MERLNIKQRDEKDFYRIQLNDDGEFVEFDLQDVSLPIKFTDAYEGIKNLEDKCKKRVIVIQNKYKNSNEEEASYKMTKEISIAYNELYNEGRLIMNKLLGRNDAMNILFGDKNYYEMFNDLFESLEPHIDKMGLTKDNVLEKLRKKYSKNKMEVL